MSQLRKVRIEMTGRANMIATAIAFVAVAIAAAQWWNTRQQLVLNLFEKRFQVFLDVRKIASEALQNGRIDSTGLINEILARGRFLFGPELVEELKRLYSLVSELETETTAEKQTTAAIEIRKQFEKITPMFEPYLKMPQQMPLDMLRRILGPW
jgi:hypothetical protein